MKLTLTLLVIIAMNTCGNTTKTMAGQSNNNNITKLNGSYHITTLYDLDVIMNNLSIDFNDQEQKLSGFSGCNRFFGKYTLEANTIEVGPLASTKMLCRETANTIESKIHDALSKINRVIIDGELLKLAKDNTIIITATKSQGNETVFNYSALSRGKFEDITISKSTISVKKDRNSKPIKKTCSKADWQKLISLLKDIPLDSLPKLKAPTEARFYDGAAIGKLKINYNNVSYESSNFDHGKPPKAIEVLVKEILSIGQNIE
ncbi:META domain-containing protein [Snuella sedimenti]|uniref:META domain-containing protein n=1 Tax=Snuella sedimenti TaxID=2798802 RepID=A0A8J7LN93_9FLAO|nr:META domain-containing protein [Snuella sedimenti]MBJ6367588.1 META domain-containing protein [Snuella sedimenti]